ncbi:MAG TPA: response regulator [Terriglobales bacterium]|nr:response regulator [Terriglobales bacterium]
MPDSAKPVLLVDDDTQVLESLAVLLELHGYPVATASDGEKALDLMRSGVHPCLIVLDLMMPNKDGYQFREEQTQDQAIADIPVVVCSAILDVEGATEGLGAEHYLSKPVDISALLALVDKYCPTDARA